MLKKIDVADARIGMYLDEVCGSWFDHPFWRKSFLLATDKQLGALHKSGIREIWIDTDKGLDVESPPPPEAEITTVEAAETVQELPPPPRETSRTAALHEELERARKIHKKAKAAVMYMFHDVRMGKALQLDDTYELVDDITQSLVRNSNAFLSLSRMKEKDGHTYMHSIAVCALMIAVGRQYGLSEEELRNLGVAGLLHDTGMLRVPDRILNKTRALTDEEMDVIRTHPQQGWEILKGAPEINEMVLDVCLNHHERVDGSGYPALRSGAELSLFTKICTVCDTYDTLTSDRHYQRGIAPVEAIRKMTVTQPGHFDLNVFHAFVKTIGIYPTGTLVKLNSGRLAVVTDQAQKSLLTPIVKVFFSTRLKTPIFPELVDLSKAQDAIASVENPTVWGLNLQMITGI